MVGIILILISILSPFFLFILHPYVVKVTNNYLFWLPFSILILIYAISCRYYHDWSVCYEYLVNNKIPTYDMPHDEIVSRAFCFDFCPFALLFILISLIFDPSRKIASYISPIALFSGLITISSIYLSSGTTTEPKPELTWHYIFVGGNPDLFVYMTHFLLIVISTLVLLNTPSLGWKGFIKSNIIALSFFVYVWIFGIGLFSLNTYVTGLSKGDWTEGGLYYPITKTFNMDYPSIIFVVLLIVYLIIGFLFYLNYKLQNFNKYKIYNIKNKQFLQKGYYAI